MKNQGALVLADGTVFEGEVLGARASLADNIVSGEVVFNTVLSGYQEVLTDPSYAGQIITFTYPHIGNYGTTREDAESRRAFARGTIVRDLQETHSNWRGEMSLPQYLAHQNLSVISGIDTRRLTRHIRERGSISGAFGTANESELLARAKAEPGTKGIDLVAAVTCKEPYMFGSADASRSQEAEQAMSKVVAIDFGIKTSILQELQKQLGDSVGIEVVPASTSASEILARKPAGVFLSNGPGDPSCTPYASETVSELLGEVPIFGICMGFQFIAQALGAEIYKLPFGHHGGNHPVMRIADKEVEITSQNHNFAVRPESLNSEVEITHINLNDETLEGLRVPKLKVLGIQYHPEASPGPHDSRYLFSEFRQMVTEN